MTSTKPYLIRAIYEWCVDQGLTPYLAVAVDARTRVPREYVKEGQIVLNVGAEATSQLQMSNEEVTFQARFNGVAFPVHVPIGAVSAIYARENGQGIAFEAEAELQVEENADGEAPSLADQVVTDEAPPPSGSGPKGVPPPARRSHLTRVK